MIFEPRTRGSVRRHPKLRKATTTDRRWWAENDETEIYKREEVGVVLIDQHKCRG